VKFYKNINPIQMGFIEDLVLMIVKGNMHVCCGEPLVETISVAPLWSNQVSILETTCS
jgi:hypothetical protein